MTKKTLWLTGLILMFVFSFAVDIPADETCKSTANKPAVYSNQNLLADSNNNAKTLYESLGLAAKGLGWETFKKAWHGFAKLNQEGFIKNPVLTIADMSQPSCHKRLYIIDMLSKQLLINTLVAHGRNSGDVNAARFSNTPESLQSSLGFYITGCTYDGHNGYSMRLKGMEKGFNDQAENRAIVMHGAPYVDEDIARKTGRIGRSWGCPAVSLKEHQQIINLVKNGSCLFVFAPEKQYLAKSSLAADDLKVL
ncbi:murein L,D-transpeptidase catalytic domain family protein [soil metagenome]